MCPGCGSTQVAAVRQASRGGQITAIVGGVLLAVGVFLPWASLGMLSANGIDKTDSEALVLVGFGLIGALSALAALTEQGRVASIVPALMGVIGGGLTAFYYIALAEHLDGLQGNAFAPQIGYGIYVCFIGALLLLVGGVAAVGAWRRARRQGRR